MRVLIVSAVFPPEPLVSARTSADLAATLHSRGDSVRVLAPVPTRPTGMHYPGYSRRLYAHEIAPEGYEIIRCLAASSKQSMITSRLWENLTFGMSAAWRAAWEHPRPDVIYSNTWPLLATGLLALIACMRRIPLIISVQDLYPESLEIQGRLRRNGWVIKFLYAADRWIAQHSRAIVTISERFAEVYRQQRGLAPGKVHVVPNWIDFDPSQNLDDTSIREKYGIPKHAFLFVYAGAIGVAAGVMSIIKAFAHLQEFTHVHLLIAGEGSCLEACQETAASLSLHRIYFHTPWLTEETWPVLAAGDVLLLPTQGNQSMVSLPSKLLSYLLAERPIMAVGAPDSEMADIILESRCGWLFSPDQPAMLVSKMKEIVQIEPGLRATYGQNGRAYAMHHFDKDKNVSRIIEIVDAIVTEPVNPALNT